MKIFRYISIAAISIMLIGGFFVPSSLAIRPCNDGNSVNGDGCSASGQLEETYICQDITQVNGWYGRYYNYSAEHPDMDEFIPSGQQFVDGDHGDPLSVNEPWDTDWYDQQYYRFNRVDSNLSFGAGWFPFQIAPEENNYGGQDYHFGVHWRAEVSAATPGNYGFDITSDDDSWVYLDGVLVTDNSSMHRANLMHGTMNLTSGDHVVDIFFAERHFSGSHMVFVFNNPQGLTITPMPEDCHNEEPIAQDDSYSVDENSILITDSLSSVLLNDNDPDNDPTPLVVSALSAPAHGNLILNNDGSFTYTPDTDFYGNDSFTYRAFDGLDYSNPATVNITVNRVNEVPVAVNDNYTVTENSTLNINNVIGVLANDIDDGFPNSLTASLESGVSHGSLVLNANGSFVYTPNTDYFGVDSFTYQIYDGASYSNAATVNISVNRANDSPIAQSDNYQVNENSLLMINVLSGVLANDTDPDNYPAGLSANLVNNPTHGNLILNSNGSFTYTPDTNFYGSDSFTYQAYDGANYSNTALVNLTINRINEVAVANNDNYSVDANTVLNINNLSGVLANDTDPDNYPTSLTAVLETNVSHGSLTLNSNGSFTYVPNSDYFGTDSFTYQAFDGANYSNTATVNITVNRVNQVPNAEDDNYSVDENTVLNINNVSGVLANDTDPDNYPTGLSANLVNNPNHGNLTLNTDGSFTYIPTSDYFGSDSFTYYAYDGESNSNTATVNITVNRVNQVPNAEDDNYSAEEGIILDINFANGILANDTDPDNYPTGLTAVLETNVSHGSLTLNSDGSFTYVPTPDYFGSDSFTYYAYDGANNSNLATVNITVGQVNDLPIAQDDNYSVDENTVLNINNVSGVLANDTDPDNYPNGLTAVLETNVSHGSLTLNSDGSFSYIPTPDYFGIDSFTYQAFDGVNYSNLALVTIIINEIINPVAEYSISKTLITAGDIHPGDIIEFELSLVNTGQVNIVNFDVVDEFDANILNFWQATPQAPDVVTSSTVAWLDLFSTEDPLLPGQSWVEHIFFQVNPQAPAGSATNTLRITDVIDSNNNTPGEDEVTITTFEIVDLPLGNLAPIAFDDQYILGQNYNEAPVLRQKDVYETSKQEIIQELESKSLISKVFSKVADGFDKLISLAVFKVAQAITVDDVSLQAEEALVIEEPVIIEETKLEIIPTEIKPVEDIIVPEELPTETPVDTGNSNGGLPIPTVDQDLSREGDDSSLVVDALHGILANDNDPDNGPEIMIVQLVDNVTHGVLALNSDGSFTYTPNIDYFGSDSFTYRVFDGELYSNVATVNIIGNEVPQALNDQYTMNENSVLNIAIASGILANDIDPDNYPTSSLIAILSNNVTHGVLALNSDGSFTYTPNTDYFGTDVFTYQAYDGDHYSNIATTTITVNDVTPPPSGGGGGGGGGGSFNNNPQSPSIIIDNGRATTSSSNVVLTLSATNMTPNYAPTQMMLSNDQDMTGANWIPYSTTYNWTLQSGYGQKTVYAVFRNSYGTSQKVSDDIQVVFTPQILGIKEFSKCTDETEEGDLIMNKNIKDHATVYYIGGDCRKYFFPDPKTYFTWYEDWSNIKRVDVDILDQHPDGGGVTYRPGTKLIKSMSTAKVYAVEPGGRLVWIPSPEVAMRLYGQNWENLLQDVIEGYFITTYVKDGQLSNVLPTGSLAKDSTTIYYIENGLKLPFLNRQAFAVNNLRDKNVLNTSVANYPLGSTISGFVNNIWDVVASVANQRQ